ncbi:S41 family peptidase [Dactylosporangium aurantiacum]|uniref:S41 family peptidase n=1 Tax=Dactylosporangium aurantiacum TaxID=35754 RepID=A0A9Q9IU68_9ACTN|nr:S41 family peptidase [Dactylosporangium aurantiacum]MDG6103729.1 S41 family peptidase [Dactylosporangium aurantiacum]UWZ59053.1 S41 family peptidase [Dactylosporangium aurantiacum]
MRFIDGVHRLARRRVRRYLLHALDVIESTALHRDTVDWPATRADALAGCADAVTYAGTHDTIAAVLRRAGGAHSGLRRPGVRGAGGPATAVPTGDVVGGAGHLRLPSCAGEHRAYRDAGLRTVRGLAAAGVTGWVVDLRGNQGGNMWPMLAVLAPLLPDGVLGHFVPPDGPDRTWTLRRGRVLLDGRTLARAPVGGVSGTGRIAVLTDGRTASSGEAVAVALRGRPHVRGFGAATAGMTSANETHLLRDGARMHVTVAWFADHRRTVHRGPLPPDEPGGADPLAAAVVWLRA